jgi:catechol-2,3-dioxygenase
MRELFMEGPIRAENQQPLHEGGRPMAQIAELGHVGIHVNDLAMQREFYHDVLGLTVTDENQDMGMIFLSARPEQEHHEFLLCGGRTAPPGTLLLQQVSFRCEGLEDVQEFYRRLKARDVAIDMVVSHGNAIGVYFYDPEGNRLEVYYSTGFKAQQPYLESIDLEQPANDILAQVEESVKRHNRRSYVDRSLLSGQSLG